MRIRHPILLSGVVLLLAAACLVGDRRMPTGPAGGGGGSGPTTGGSLPSPFQVAAFNIHGCKGADGRRDVDRVARSLEGIDIAGLNEVVGFAWSDPKDQVARLAELCRLPGRNCVFAPAETQWFGIKRFGNGLVLRQRLLAWQRIPLPRHNDPSCRNILLAYVDRPNGPLALVVTHLAPSSLPARERQLEAVLDLFASLEPPTVLLGDLNTPPGDPRMARFLEETDAVDAIAEGGVSDGDRVDWILVRGLECLGSERVDTGASDHPLFMARLR